jgi:hypothetical protein
MPRFKCDWPGCQETTEQQLEDNWAYCCDHPDIDFLPDPANLCPHHARAYDDLACNVQPPTSGQN